MARGRGRGKPPLAPRKRGRPPKNKVNSGRKKLPTEIIPENAKDFYSKPAMWAACIEKEFSPAFEKFHIQEAGSHAHTGYENLSDGHEANHINRTHIVNTNIKKSDEIVDKDSLETNCQALIVENVHSNKNTDHMNAKISQVVSNSSTHEIESSSVNVTSHIYQLRKLPPLKIHKSRFISTSDVEDDDKTPEYPLTEDFFFNASKIENDPGKDRNVFSAMCSAMSYNGIDSYSNVLSSTETKLENNANSQESKKLSNDGNKFKVQRIQMIPKLTVPSSLSSGNLVIDSVDSDDKLAEDFIEDKHGDTIPRLSPVEDSCDANIKLPCQIFNSQPPKLIRICSEKVSPLSMYSANNHIENNISDRYRNSIEQNNLKESRSADKLAFTNKNEENETINDGVSGQVDETSILANNIDSHKAKDRLYQLSATNFPDKTTSSLAQGFVCETSCSENTLKKHYSCHNELISDDELSPKPLMIDEYSQLENNVKESRSSCSETMGKPVDREVKTMQSGHSEEESVRARETQPSPPHHEPIDSLKPSQPQNSLPPPDHQLAKGNSKGAVNKDSRECNDELRSWLTIYDSDISGLVHSTDKLISGITSPQNLCYKDNLAKKIISEKENKKNFEAKTVEEMKQRLNIHNGQKSTMIKTNKNISVPSGAIGLDCLGNSVSVASCISDPLVCLPRSLDSIVSVHQKYVNKRTGQDIADIESTTSIQPGQQLKPHDKHTPSYPAENQIGSTIIESHLAVYTSTPDNLIQTNERSRHTDRNKSYFHNDDPLPITTPKDVHEQNRDLSDRRLSSSRSNALPFDSFAHYYSSNAHSTNRSNIHSYQPSMTSVSEGLSIYREPQKTCFDTANIKASADASNGIKESQSYSAINPHHNIESLGQDLSAQHNFSQCPKQSYAPHNSGHMQYVQPPEAAHPNSQFYPVSTYGQHSASIMSGPQSSGHFHPYPSTHRNYPVVTLQYLHNEMMQALPKTVHANMPLPVNNYVCGASNPWSNLGNSEQQTHIHSHTQREPYISYKGKNDLLHSERLLPQSQFCIQEGRSENLYHYRKAPSHCPDPVASAANLTSSYPYPQYQWPSDKSVTARKIQQNNNLHGHCVAILAAQRLPVHESSDTSREKMMYPSWVRVPEASNIDKSSKQINTGNFKAKKSKSNHENSLNVNIMADAQPSNQLRNVTDNVMEPPAQKQSRVQNRQLRTSKDNCNTAQRTWEEPLDLSISTSKSCSQFTSTSSKSSSDISSINFQEVGVTLKTTSTNMELNAHSHGSRPNDVLGPSKKSSNTHDKTSEKIGNYFKETSTVTEPDMMGNPLKFVASAGSTDLPETRSGRVYSSSSNTSASNASTINWASNISSPPSSVPRMSRSSSQAAFESIEATPPKNIRIPLEKFQTSTPDKNSYASMMIEHITSKVKKNRETSIVADELMGFFQLNDVYELGNRLNYSVIDLTEGDDVICLSSEDSDDEDKGVDYSKRSGSRQSFNMQSEPSQSLYSHMDSDILLTQDDVGNSDQDNNVPSCKSLKVNKAVKESMALRVQEAVALHSSSNDIAAQSVPVSATNVKFPTPNSQAITSSVNIETPEPSAEQAAATLLMLSANPLYNNLMIIPETSESYQEKVYQIQPLLGKNETNSSQEIQTSKSHSASVRSGTKTGRRVGRPPKDEVWPQKNTEAVSVQQGTTTFAGNFDTSLVHSRLTALTMSQINNENVDNRNSFPKPPIGQQMNHMPPFAESVHQFPSATVKRIDPKVAQLINFRLNKKNKEALESANKADKNQTDPGLLPERMGSTLNQSSVSSNSTANPQEGIVKTKRKRRTKKEMLEAALLQGQNPHKKPRNKYRPRLKKKKDAAKQTVENGYENCFVPFGNQILSSQPTEARPMVNELAALTGYISPPATPDQSRKQATHLENPYHIVKEQGKRLILEDFHDPTRQTNTNAEELMNLEHFIHQRVVTQAHNEDGLVVISLLPAQQLETPLLAVDKALSMTRDSRNDICVDKDLLSQRSLQGPGVCADNLWLMSDKEAQGIDRTEEEEVIDWLSKNSRKK